MTGLGSDNNWILNDWSMDCTIPKLVYTFSVPWNYFLNSLMFINWLKALSELHASNEPRAQGNGEKWRRMRVLDWHSISNLRSGLLFSLLLFLQPMFVSPRPRPLKKRSTKHDLILFSQSQTTCHSRSQISDNLLMPLDHQLWLDFSDTWNCCL